MVSHTRQEASSPPGADDGLNASDIQRILDEVSVAGYLPPPDLDQPELLRDLNTAWDFYRIRKQTISKPRNNAIRKYGGKVVNAANDLSEILNQENEAADYFRNVFPVNDLQIILRLLQRSAAAATSPFPKLPSPNEFFFGVQLPIVFERHFKREAKYSRRSDGGPPKGPFIRFATAVACALGLEVSAETVVKAIGAARKGNSKHP
jgi:hypothetical protein